MVVQRKNKTSVLVTRSACKVFLLAALVVCAGAGSFDVFSHTSESLQVSASFADKQVAADEAIELRLNRPLRKEEGSLALIVGKSDLSALLIVTEKSLRYDPKTLPLPLGESQVILYLVSEKNEWKETARFTLRVGRIDGVEGPGVGGPGQGVKDTAKVPEVDSTAAPRSSATDAQPPTPGADTASSTKQSQKRLGFEKLDLIPSVTVSFKSQTEQSNFPAINRPERATFTDLNLQMSFKGDIDRGLFTSQSQFDFVGASFKKEALRFGQLGERAPQVDLSSYLMQFKLGKVRYQVGHFSFGANRHLVNGFSSRGLMVSVPLGNRADFALSAMNGTSIVGYSNFFGVDKSKHRLVGGTLGFELMSKRPGGMRVEASLLDAWLQPVNGFSQGSINDAERSRGAGFRVLASDSAQRFKIDAGISRSTFTSPSDPLLNQGRDVKPFPSITGNARYLDASYDILKGLSLTKQKKVNLSFGFRHEQVDPLYRSLGASTQADKVSNDFSLTGSIGEINAQFTHGRFNDNLGDVPSILKSLTRANTFAVGVPLASILGDAKAPSRLLPRVSYTINLTHQFGAAIPVRGGFEFDPGSIPDQLSTNQSITADWQIENWRLGYRLNHSFQNNQQPGRELSDFANLVNGFTVGIAANRSLDLNFDLNAESANNREAGTIDRTLRLSPSINWRMSKRATLASSLSTTLAGDDADTK